MGVVAVVSLHDETLRIIGEVRNGLVKPGSYLLVKFILTLPIIVIFALTALGIPMFAIQTFERRHILSVACQWSLVVYLFESVAEFLAALFSNATNGILTYLSYWVLCFLFGGIFITPESIYWPLKTFYYAMPFSYYVRSMMFILFHDWTCRECDPSWYSKDPNAPLCYVDSTNGADERV